MNTVITETKSKVQDDPIYKKAISVWNSDPAMRDGWIDADAFARSVVLDARAARAESTAKTAATESAKIEPMGNMKTKFKAAWAANTNNCRSDFIDQDVYVRAMVRDQRAEDQRHGVYRPE